MEAMPEGASRAGTALAPREWALAGLLALAFAPALLALAGVWREVDYQSHGFLVPVVSLWVAMREAPRRRRLAAESDPRGLFLLALALIAYLAGLAGGVLSLQGVALVAAVAGTVWLLRGAGVLRALAFPIGFLLFMVPIPPGWIGPLIVKLQLLVSRASVWLLDLFGFGVTREGNVLVLPSGQAMFVAEACSGITSIVTLTPLAVLLGYFTLSRLSSKLALVLAVIPIAMLGNLVRVVGVCVAAEYVGAELVTEGPPHELFGLLTYAVAVGLMLAVGTLLRRRERAT